MKIWKYFIAPMCIVIAILGILENANIIMPIDTYVGEISPIRVCSAIVLMALLIDHISKLKICRSIFLFSLLIMLLERNIAWVCLGRSNGQLISNWHLLFYTLLICFGLWLILPKRRFGWSISRNDRWMGEDNGRHENNFGSRTIYVDAASFTERNLENNFGSMVVKFENHDAYIGGGLLRVENNFGSVEICVPANWSLSCQFENSFAGIDNRFGKGGNGPSLMISGESNFGHVTIRKA